ncbi:MAG TPA: replicative DNA helicase [Cyclobacteriaceae bacterium]|nr:replicative DNA helicase [Cyclobacteriaceae bacterium]
MGSAAGQLALKQKTGSNKKLAARSQRISHKLPPQALDLEEAVIGAVLLEKNALPKLAGILYPDHFYSDKHRFIFEAVLQLFSSSNPVDMRTVVNQLRKNGRLELVGGAYAIGELTAKVNRAANIEYDARIIIELSLKRRMIEAASTLHQQAYNYQVSDIELLDYCSKVIFEIQNETFKKEQQPLSSLMAMAMKDIGSRRTENTFTGVPSGFAQLDSITGGWQNSDLIIIAARPGMGKTGLILSALRNAAADHRLPVAFYSLEMNATQLTNRLLSAESTLPLKNFLDQSFTQADWNRMISSTTVLASSPLFIDDSPSLSLYGLRAKIRFMKAIFNIKLAVVDYLQLMESTEGDNREQEISSISRGLKAIAKELNIPFIALSQLSRGVESRGDKRPQLSDLRESGAIEQDADMVLFLYRPEYYKIELTEEGWPTTGLAELIIAKHRNGGLDTVKLRFEKETVHFKQHE